MCPTLNNFMLLLPRGQDKNSHIRAIANSFYDKGYISIKEGANLTREGITVVKSI